MNTKKSDKGDACEFSLLAWPALLTHVSITTAVAGVPVNKG